jgi:hypothetical protein
MARAPTILVGVTREAIQTDVAGGKFLLENLLPAGQIAALFRLGRFGLGSCCSPGRSGGGTGRGTKRRALAAGTSHTGTGGNEPQTTAGRGTCRNIGRRRGRLGAALPRSGIRMRSVGHDGRTGSTDFRGGGGRGSRLPSGRSIEPSIKPKVYERSRAENLTLGYFTRLPTTNQRW